MRRKIDIDGRTFTVVVRPRTYMGNLIGYSVVLSEAGAMRMIVKMVNKLSPQEAMGYAINKWRGTQ